MSEPVAGTAATPRTDWSPSRRRRAALVIGGGAVVAVAIAVGLWIHARSRESTDDAQIEGNIVPIGVRVGGTVKEVLVDDNQVVEAGTVLMRIDPADYEVALRKAEAEAADAAATANAARSALPITATTAASQLATARAGLAAARQEAGAAEARLAEALANRTRAASDLARYTTLIAKDEISKQQFDAAVSTDASARAAVEAAQSGLAAARSRVAQAEAQIRAAETAPHQVDAARARSEAADAVARKNASLVEQAKLNLGYTTVSAPVGGVVSRKSVQPGQVLQPGQQVMAIVPLDKIWVVANFKESQLRSMRPGQRATVYVDAYGRTYRGHVDSIGGATAGKFSMLPAENASGNFVKVVQRLPVKIVLDQEPDAGRPLRPGMSVVPTVVVK